MVATVELLCLGLNMNECISDGVGNAHAFWKEYPAGANGNAINSIKYEPSLMTQVELYYGRFLDFAVTGFVNYYLDS